jgi:Transmembrane secretion effector
MRTAQADRRDGVQMRENNTRGYLSFRPNGLASVFLPLRERNVFIFFAGDLISMSGDFVALFAIYAIATFSLRAGPFSLSMISIAYLLPSICFGPLAGVIVDRSPVKLIMISVALTQAAVVLAFITVRSMQGIYVTLFVLGSASTLLSCAQTVAMRQLMSGGDLLRINSLLSIGVRCLQLACPGIAAWLLLRAGEGACFVLDSASFIAFVMFVRLIRLPRTDISSTAPQQKSDWNRLLIAICTEPRVAVSLAGSGVIICSTTCLGMLLGIFVRDYLKRGLGFYAALDCFIGAGAIIAVLLQSRSTNKISLEQVPIIAAATISLSIFWMVALNSVVPSAVAMVFIGGAAAALAVSTQTMVQQSSPVHLLGWSSSILGSYLTTCQLLGMVVAGPLAHVLGINILYYAIAALLGCVTVLLRWFMFRRHHEFVKVR